MLGDNGFQTYPTFALKDSSSILAFLCLGWSEKTLKPFLLRVRAFLHLISILFYGLGHWKRKTNKIWNWRAGKKIEIGAQAKKIQIRRKETIFSLAPFAPPGSITPYPTFVRSKMVKIAVFVSRPPPGYCRWKKFFPTVYRFLFNFQPALLLATLIQSFM